VQQGAVADRDLITERGGMGPAHHVHDTAILDICPSTDPDTVHITAEDGVHPDAAVVADNDVADDLGTLVDKRGRCHARMNGLIRAQH